MLYWNQECWGITWSFRFRQWNLCGDVLSAITRPFSNLEDIVKPLRCNNDWIGTLRMFVLMGCKTRCMWTWEEDVRSWGIWFEQWDVNSVGKKDKYESRNGWSIVGVEWRFWGSLTREVSRPYKFHSISIIFLFFLLYPWQKGGFFLWLCRIDEVGSIIEVRGFQIAVDGLAYFYGGWTTNKAVKGNVYICFFTSWMMRLEH